MCSFGDFINSPEQEEDTSTWSSGLGLKDSWMDMLPMSALSEVQRTNQYLAEARENAERLTRGETALDPNEKGGTLHK